MHLTGQTVRISMKIFILNKVHFKQLMLAVTVFNINIFVQSGIFTLLFLWIKKLLRPSRNDMLRLLSESTLATWRKTTEKIIIIIKKNHFSCTSLLKKKKKSLFPPMVQSEKPSIGICTGHTQHFYRHLVAKYKIKKVHKKLLTYRMRKGQNYSQWGKDMQKNTGQCLFRK